MRLGGRSNRTGKALEFGCRDGSVGRRFDGEAKGSVSGMDKPSQDPVYVGDVVTPNSLGECSLGHPGLLEDGSEVAHTVKIASSSQTRQVPYSRKGLLGPYNLGMASWAYRDAFDAEYQAYRAATSDTLEGFAAKVGKEPVHDQLMETQKGRQHSKQRGRAALCRGFRV